MFLFVMICVVCFLMLEVGCGAIGCEMLKNYAMMGVGIGPSGLVSGCGSYHVVVGVAVLCLNYR